MIILQAIAFFFLIWFGSMKLWNLAVAAGGAGASRTEPQFIDVTIAISATTLYVTHVLM